MLKPIAVDELRSTTICHPKVKIFCARPNLLTEALYKSIRISASEGRIWKRQGIENIGGATRDRTADLVTASHALSQLSYSPTRKL